MKHIIKRLAFCLLSLTILAGCAAPSQQNTQAQQDSAENTAAPANTDTAADTEESIVTQKEETLFDKYISNTYISTSNNQFIESSDGVTYRAYLPAEVYGDHEYCFYFSNIVDSTYDKGAEAYVGKHGGNYKISDAFIADGGKSTDDAITNRTAVTFGGKTEKDVSPDEAYWSDPVRFELGEGNYIVWEWKVTGKDIPCTNMSYLTNTTADSGSGNFETCDNIPLPQLIGCDRKVKHYICAIGDSITQGVQTSYMAFEYWAARISQKLGPDYGFYNCGLGWSRASDAAISENWTQRASAGDITIVAFGTNDIESGKYGQQSGDSAYEIDKSLRTVAEKLKANGCNVILFNSPPENFPKTAESVRTELNGLIPLTAKEYGIEFFDFAGLLCPADEPQKALYGAHPNGEGGDVVSDAFIKQFSQLLGK